MLTSETRPVRSISSASESERDAATRSTHQDRLRRARPVLLLRSQAMPHPARIEFPGGRGVREQRLERPRELRLDPDVADGRNDLDAVVEVARHQVGAAEVIRAVVAGLEDK